MTAKPKDAMDREQGHLPVIGLEGSIMNPTVLKKMDAVIRERTEEYNKFFHIESINTSSKALSGDVKKTCEKVVGKVLSWIEETTQEHILSAPRTAFRDLENDFVVLRSKAEEIVSKFESAGDFRPRSRVECDLTRIQPLPVVVVRNNSGKILQLTRKERDPKNKLHKKIVLWAGGHVRREDNCNGKPIILGAIRELQEELRLYVEPDELSLLGAVYVANGESDSTKKHLAIVYEWNAPNDDVEVALAKSEFFEKGGASLTGTFLPPEKISIEEGEGEAWSTAILNELLASSPSR